MPLEVDFNNLPPFPTRIPEKLKTIRERLALSPDEIAPRVGVKSGPDILEYESGRGRSTRERVVGVR